MPSPIFIICSEGGSIDRHTNQLSIFDVIEKLSFQEFVPPTDSGGGTEFPKAPGRVVTINSIRMTAYWRRDPGDNDSEFEFRTTIELPGRPPITAGEGKFVFKAELHRLLASIHTDMPSQSGRIIVRNSARRVGSDDWVTQEYIVPVEKIELSANQTPSTPS